MRRAQLLLIAFISSGCATATEPPGAFTLDTGTGLADTRVTPTDTRVVEEDTYVAEEDTGSTTLDSGSPFDSASPIDTGSIADSATVDSSVTDTELPDTAFPVDTSVVVDSAPSETGGGPTRIYTGASLRFYGVTTDDYAVVGDSAGSSWAIPLAGGAPQSIGTGTSYALVRGKVVFAWGTVDGDGFAPLRVWSAATGSTSVATKSLAPTSSSVWVAAASADGNYIFYTDGGTVGLYSDDADFKVARTDGTDVRTVFNDYAIYDYYDGYYEDCAPFMGWVGSRFVTTHCTPGFTISLDASSIDPATGAATRLGTGLSSYWSADDAGTKVAIVAGGALRVLPVTGGTATSIESGVSLAVFTHDGGSVLYRTTANALKRSPSTSSAPTTLVTSGATAMLTVPSPNDQWFLYAGAGSSGAFDIRRASTTTPGTTTLHAAANADVYGAAFTADSAYAIYYTSVTTIGVGNLVAYPMVGGSPTTLGTGAWYDFAIGGSKLVFNDNHSGTSTSGTATIRVVDVATGANTAIVTGADRNFGMNAALNRVVYVMPSDGLYVAPVP